MPVVSAGGQRGTERDRGGEGDLSAAVVSAVPYMGVLWSARDRG